jgi:predicted esterase
MLMRPLATFLVPFFLTAADPAPGQLTEKVVCRSNADQSYAIYIPSKYNAQKPWPILYCLDPGARGRVPVERFAQAAEKLGFIVVGSNNSRNGPIDIARQAIDAMLDDTMARFAIDDKRIYATGFSGGSRTALQWARGGSIAGVIACGAAFSGDTAGAVPKDARFPIFAATGVDDFNYHEMHAMSLELAKRGIPNRFAEFNGGHEWLPAELAMQALQFLSGELPPQPASDSKDQRKRADRFQALASQLTPENPSRQGLIEKLKKEAAAPNDSNDRRVARQVLEGTFVGSVEQGRAFVQQKRYDAAVPAWETAALIHPDRANIWLALAQAQAGGGLKKKALDSLEHAIQLGLERDRVRSEPIFESLRSDPRYRTLFEK